MLKKCKCGNEFEQYRTTQKTCIPCLIEKAKTIVKKETKIKDRETLEKYETLTEVSSKLQKTINHIARLIDKNQTCRSCNGKVEQGGHYYPSGNNKTVTFHLDNIHGQCVHCNMHLSGNLIEYRTSLIDEYGLEYMEHIESLRLRYKSLKYSKEQLREAHSKAYEVLKELQRNNESYTKLERIELREHYNKEIGIYN